MSRERDLNCTNAAAVLEMTAVFRWLDEEPSLTVAILTGAGKKAFSTGADLKEWNAKVAQLAAEGKDTGGAGPGNAPGAEGLSNRRGKKPIIAAVNGMAYGGGCENVVNCDIVIASGTATFELVEVKRGQLWVVLIHPHVDSGINDLCEVAEDAAFDVAAPSVLVN